MGGVGDAKLPYQKNTTKTTTATIATHIKICMYL